ncbi:MAG: 7-cyano-7-deazaguanine synthase [Balneolaceae bacterium]
MKTFIFEFPEIKERFTIVRYSLNGGKDWNTFKVEVKDKILKYRVLEKFPPLSADLIDIATAVFVADWISYRKLSGRPSDIIIRSPVRMTNLLSGKEAMEELKNLLGWFTEDHWHFEFSQRTSMRNVEKQSMFSFEIDGEVEVALWSGGLDSLAGLYSRYKVNPELKYVLAGSGFSKRVIGVQRDVHKNLKEKTSIKTALWQVPFYLEDSPSHRKHSYMRSRGFAFMIVGSAIAIALDQRKLHLYENGIGAINLPYFKFEIGLDHTRSVHPISLSRTTDYVSSLLEEDFEIINPFVFKTKTQICRSLIDDNLTDLIFRTQTCDSVHRKEQSQCGYCSSCLLRRQALLANNVVDKTEYVLTHGKPKSKDIHLHFDAITNQVQVIQKILSGDKNLNQKWYRLINEYPVLEKTATEMSNKDKIPESKIRKSLIDMYLDYSYEWLSVQKTIRNSYPEPISV